MTDLGLQLIEGLLGVARAHDADKVILKSFFEQHLQGQNRRALASHVLETVLQHIKSDEDVTDLHRQVLNYLIKTLREDEANGSHGRTTQAFAKFPQEVHEAGGHEATEHDFTPKVPKLEKPQQQRPIKQEKSGPGPSGMPAPGAYPPIVTKAEQQHAAQRKKFLQDICGDAKSPPRKAAPKPALVSSPTLTADLERRRASSPINDPWYPSGWRTADPDENF